MKNQSSPTRKRKQKTAVTVGVVLAVLALLTGTVLAAYIGTGSKKGVLATSSYHFASDVLKTVVGTVDESVTINDLLNENPVACEKHTQTIRIQNYENLSFNVDAVKYNLKIWLSATDTTNYTYSYRINGSDPDPWNELNATAYPGVSTELNLTGGSIDYDTLEIQWTWKGSGEEDTSLASRVYVIAEPVSPSYLVSKKIGAVISLQKMAEAAAYQLQYGFHAPTYNTWTYQTGKEPVLDDSKNYTAPLTNYSAFQYRVTVTGTPPVGEKLTLTWTSKLKLSPFGSYTSEGNSITITLEANKTYTIIFVRNYLESDENNSGWTESDEVVTTLGSVTPVVIPGTSETPKTGA